MSLFNLGNTSIANAAPAGFGDTPTGLYSGLNPAAASPQAASSGGLTPQMAMMLMQAIGHSAPSTPQQPVQFGQFQDPQAQVSGPALGQAMMQRR